MAWDFRRLTQAYWFDLVRGAAEAGDAAEVLRNHPMSVGGHPYAVQDGLAG